MTTEKKIVKNSLFFFTARAIDMSSALALNVLIARSLGVASFGEYSFMMAYVVSIMTISYFGLDRITVRELAKHPERAPEFLGAIISTRWILSLSAVLIVALCTPLLGLRPELLPALAILTLSEFVGSSSTVFMSVFRAYESIQYETYITTLWRVVNLALVAVAAALGLGLIWMCAAMLLANIPRSLASIWVVRRKFLKPSFTFERGLLKVILKDVVLLGAVVLLTNWFFRSAQMVLNYMKGPEHVAYYQVSVSIIQQLSTIAMAVGVSVYPMISRSATHAEEDVKKASVLFNKVSRVLLLMGFVLSVGFGLGAGPFMLLFFGPEYVAGVPAAVAMAPAVVPLFLQTLLMFSLVAYGMQRFLLVAWALSLTLSLGLYFALIPTYGAMGAAWGFLAATVLLIFVEARFMKIAGLGFLRVPLLPYTVNIILSVAVSLAFLNNLSLTIKATVLLLALAAAGWQALGILRMRGQKGPRGQARQ